MSVESLELKSNLEHTKTENCEIVNFYPSNGASFVVPNDNHIEIPIPVCKNGFVDPRSVRVNLKWKASFTTTSTNYNVLATQAGSAGLIEKYELYNGSNLIEEIDHYNRTYANLQKMFCNSAQMQGNGSCRDSSIAPIGNQTFTGAVGFTTTYATNTPSVGDRMGSNNLTPRTIEASISLELSDLLGASASKLLPCGLTNPWRVRLYLSKNVENVFYLQDTDTTRTAPPQQVDVDFTDGKVTITDVSISAKQLTYDDETMNKMLDAVKKTDGVLHFNGTQLRPVSAPSNYQSEVQVILGNSQWTNLKGMMCFPYYSVLSKSGDCYGCYANGCYQARLLIDGVAHPLGQPIGNGDSQHPERSLSEFIMSLMNCNRTTCKIYSSKTQFTRGKNPVYREAPTGTQLNYTFEVPCGTSNCNIYQYGVVPQNASPAVIGNNSTLLYPNQAISYKQFGKITPYCGWGFRLTSSEHGKEEVGINTQARQVVVGLRQSNTITSDPAGVELLAVQQVGVKYVLDMNRGTIEVKTNY